ncbi:SPOR domain-containing protein [Ramlibacter algicola]|uniref:SPOR domain-containing protein n=1 Tax=Ramlibacter algicola TaxID=2795217 RepID=A0A934UPP2_9BURK|nr:SPOR domain-containing protein [Ramlibacter algicola]MBK0391300.1 SPOR domain-containing protein [Ramlibacter algicola]
MLRVLVLLLLLANGAWFAWARGDLQAFGLAPAAQSEPHRLQQQIRPEAIRVLSADEARRIETAARGPECLQAGPLDDAAAGPLRQSLASWPAGSWTLEPVAEGGRWIVYMGKYPNDENVARKKSELRQIGVAFETLANAELEPGLSLGGFPTQAEANAQLERLAARGVRTARVMQERAPVSGWKLTLPALDDALRARVDDVRPALGGKTLRPCR